MDFLKKIILFKQRKKSLKYLIEIEESLQQKNEAKLEIILEKVQKEVLLPFLLEQDENGYSLLHTILLHNFCKWDILKSIFHSCSAEKLITYNNKGLSPLGLSLFFSPKLIIEHHDSINQFIPLNDINSFFDTKNNEDINIATILYELLKQKEYELAKILIDYGIFDLTDNFYSKDPLLCAMLNNDTDSVCFLLENYSDKYQITDSYGKDFFLNFILYKSVSKEKPLTEKDKKFLKELIDKNIYSFDYSSNNLSHYIRDRNIKYLSFFIDDLHYDITQNSDEIFNALCSYDHNSLRMIEYFVHKGLKLDTIHSFTENNFPNHYFILCVNDNANILNDIADYFFDTLKININQTFRNDHITLAHNLGTNGRCKFPDSFLLNLAEKGLDFTKANLNGEVPYDRVPDYLKEFIQVNVIDKKIMEEKEQLSSNIFIQQNNKKDIIRL